MEPQDDGETAVPCRISRHLTTAEGKAEHALRYSGESIWESSGQRAEEATAPPLGRAVRVGSAALPNLRVFIRISSLAPQRASSSGK